MGFTAGRWRYYLEDHSGGLLGPLPRADERKLSWQRRASNEASGRLGLDDPDAKKLIDALSNGIPILRVTRDEKIDSQIRPVLRHRGFIAPESVQEEMSDDGNWLSFVSTPIAKLEGRHTPELRAFDDTQAAEVGITLIENANDGFADEPASETGIRRGTIGATYTVSPVYERRHIPGVVSELATTSPGFEYELRPVDEGVVVARFDAEANSGALREDAKFARGEGTLNNLQSLNRTRERLRNRVLVFGESGVTSEKTLAGSISRYEQWDHHESMQEEIDITILDARGAELLTDFPKELTTITPDPSRSPIPLVDYTINDTVPVYGRVKMSDGNFYKIQSQVRVEGIQIDLDAESNESAHTLQVVPA